MTEFDYDLFKSTVAEEPTIFEGKHLTFCFSNAGQVSEWMQANYSASTWSDILREAESRRWQCKVSSTDNRLFVRVA